MQVYIICYMPTLYSIHSFIYILSCIMLITIVAIWQKHDCKENENETEKSLEKINFVFVQCTPCQCSSLLINFNLGCVFICANKTHHKKKFK